VRVFAPRLDEGNKASTTCSRNRTDSILLLFEEPVFRDKRFLKL
jgi:hypothetical protein